MGSVYARDVFVEVFDRVRATDAKTRSKPRRPTLRLCAPCENHAECGTHFLGIARRKLRSREARDPPRCKSVLSGRSYNPPAFQLGSSCVSNPIKTIVFWLVIVLSSVLLWQVVKAGATGNKEAEISFSRFMQDVDHGDVYEVTIAGSEVHGK